MGLLRQGLGGGREEASEGHIVGPRRDGRAGGIQVLVTGGTEPKRGGQTGARCGQIAIVSAQMHAIGPDREGQLNIVVDDQPRPVGLGQGTQGRGLFGTETRRSRFVAVLEDSAACGEDGLGGTQ